MSSILDALNKLEEEKARAQEDAEAIDIDVHEAVEDLVGRSVLRDRVTLRFTPGKLLIGGGLFVVALVAISVGLSVAVLGSKVAPVTDVPPEVVASSTPTPETTAVVSSVPDAQDDSIDESGADNTIESVAAVAPREVETPEVAAPAAPTPTVVEEPEPADSTPAPVKVEEPATESNVALTEKSAAVDDESDSPPEETTGAAEKPVVKREKVASASSDFSAERPSNESLIEEIPEPDAAVSIYTLPRLSPADLERYGLEDLRINMLKPQSASNPYPFAMINRNKIYEGQPVLESRLELYAVESDGIGLQERGTRLRYFVPF